MRTRYQYLAPGLTVSEIEKAIADNDITVDENGRIDMWIAVAFQRMISDEARELFGSSLRMPATDIFYVAEAGLGKVHPDELAGEGRLDFFYYGLAEIGRPVVQALSVEEFEDKHSCVLSTEQLRCQVLIREPDVSDERALMDSYLLGDHRLKYAVTQKIAAERSPSVPSSSIVRLGH